MAGKMALGAFPKAAIPVEQVNDFQEFGYERRKRLGKVDDEMLIQVSNELLKPNGHVPAGRLKTPAPKIHLIKLKISLGTVAVPPELPPLDIFNEEVDESFFLDNASSVLSTCRCLVECDRKEGTTC